MAHTSIIISEKLQNEPPQDKQHILTFSKMKYEDYPKVFQYSSDARMYKFFEFPPQLEIEDTRRYIKKLVQERMALKDGLQSSVWWLAESKSEAGLAIGSLALVDVNFENLSAQLGFAIGPKYWGKGYSQIFMESIMEYVFDYLKLRRLSGITMVENEPTRALVVAFGAKEEAVIKNHYRDYKGVYHDGWSYNLFAEDYFETSKISKTSKNEVKLLSLLEVKELVSNIIQDDNVGIDEEMSAIYGWDSMTHIEILIALEKKSTCKLPSSKFNEASTIRKLHRLLMEQVN